jgi:hypothetical protein
VGALELVPAAAMAQIARRDDELGSLTLDERGGSGLDVRRFAYTGVEVREVEDACSHERMRL